ncbi:Hypothetical protein Minf_0675 [Methylacidiphilum infernorum V4]|uniref:Uncharacterized protein n=1 Tax=Methylacidiphilum infernorum (isolate V4) TaxID=481448 RepID=B3E069_METI4|nr:Hypothetical protein Minf_0675 [Methylacidiphilum infernorum V4]
MGNKDWNTKKKEERELTATPSYFFHSVRKYKE